MRFFDFTSWQSLLLTFIGLALFTLISMGIRLLMMFRIQQRRERVNRQINERLKTLMSAYKTLGGSFTGTLSVDPTHMRDLRKALKPEPEAGSGGDDPSQQAAGSERSRRIRDAVEAALSDVVLLGTEEQVRLAAKAGTQLVAGERVHTDKLVASLRNFIRQSLDLAPIPADVEIPAQGPARPSGSGSRGDNRGGGRGGAGGGMGAGGSSGVAVGGSEHSTPDAPV